MLTVDSRCRVRDCADKNIYRMVGKCRNCGSEPILVLLTAGHDAHGTSDWQGYECPVCGCREVRVGRLATEEEIPVA